MRKARIKKGTPWPRDVALLIFCWTVFAWVVRRGSGKSEPARVPDPDLEKKPLAVLKEVVRQRERKLEVQAQVRKAIEDRISATATWLLTLAAATTGTAVWLESLADEKPLTGSLKDIQPALDLGATFAATALLAGLFSWLCISASPWVPWLPWHDLGSNATSSDAKNLASEEEVLGFLSEQCARAIIINGRSLKALAFLCALPLAVLFFPLLFIIPLLVPVGLKDLEDFRRYYMDILAFYGI